MDDSFKEIDAVLLPNTLEMSVKEALEKVASLCVEMRESTDLCKRLLDRLRFLHKYLPTRKSKMNSPADYSRVLSQFADTLGLVIRFFKNHSVKTLLQRIAVNRQIIKQIERLHGKINGVPSGESLELDRDERLRQKLEESSHDTSNLVGGLSGSALEEALTELQSETDPLKNQHEFRVFLKRVLDIVVKYVSDTQIPDIPMWYIRRDDIEAGEEIDIGAFGAVHKAKWGPGETEVVMKLLYLDGLDTQKSFLRKADVWYKLNHPIYCWKAPECLFGRGRAADPTVRSDVFSLGMSIIEAKIGDVPWGMLTDNDTIAELAEGHAYPCPNGVFTDREWILVRVMSEFEPTERITLAHALELLAEFGNEEAYAGEEAEAEKQLSVEFDNKSTVTRRVGSMLGIRDEDLDRVSDFIEDLQSMGRDARGKLVHHIRQVTQWTRLEQRERAIWEGAPQTNMCKECGDFNPRDSQFCCECGSVVDGYGSRYAEFRFVVPNPDGLEDAIKAFEELQQKRKKKCSVSNRKCTPITNGAINDALPNEISRLKTMMERSNDQALWLKLQEPDLETRVCDKCGDRNSDEDVFCRECGADIEIIRRNKL